MRRPFVKVCGMTRLEDALEAVDAGAQAVGFVLVPESPRYIDAASARKIADRLPEGVARVGVVVDLPEGEVRRLIDTIGLTAVQAHGTEDADACRSYGVPVVKAFPTGKDFDLSLLEEYREFPVLLDGKNSRHRGGTGVRADWGAARDAERSGFRVLLAGGLGPDNILDAVRAVSPIAVDLNSGVETAPGRKSAAMIRRAMEKMAFLEPVEEETWPW